MKGGVGVGRGEEERTTKGGSCPTFTTFKPKAIAVQHPSGKTLVRISASSYSLVTHLSVSTKRSFKIGHSCHPQLLSFQYDKFNRFFDVT